jgi:hypothetical protein
MSRSSNLGRLTRYRWFESAFLQRGVQCEPDFLDHGWRPTSTAGTQLAQAPLHRTSSHPLGEALIRRGTKSSNPASSIDMLRGARGSVPAEGLLENPFAAE